VREWRSSWWAHSAGWTGYPRFDLSLLARQATNRPRGQVEKATDVSAKASAAVEEVAAAAKDEREERWRALGFETWFGQYSSLGLHALGRRYRKLESALSGTLSVECRLGQELMDNAPGNDMRQTCGQSTWAQGWPGVRKLVLCPKWAREKGADADKERVQSIVP
jgi:hypothetical protein